MTVRIGRKVCQVRDSYGQNCAPVLMNPHVKLSVIRLGLERKPLRKQQQLKAVMLGGPASKRPSASQEQDETARMSTERTGHEKMQKDGGSLKAR